MQEGCTSEEGTKELTLLQDSGKSPVEYHYVQVPNFKHQIPVEDKALRGLNFCLCALYVEIVGRR